MQTDLVVRSHIRISIFKSEYKKKKTEKRQMPACKRREWLCHMVHSFALFTYVWGLYWMRDSQSLPSLMSTRAGQNESDVFQTLDTEFQYCFILCYRSKHSAWVPFGENVTAWGSAWEIFCSVKYLSSYSLGCTSIPQAEMDVKTSVKSVNNENLWHNWFIYCICSAISFMNEAE